MRTGKDPVLAQRSNTEHLQWLLNPATFRDRQVQESFAHWYEAYPRELIEAVVKIVPRIAGALSKPARFVLVDILNDAAWHLDPELAVLPPSCSSPSPNSTRSTRLGFRPDPAQPRYARCGSSAQAGTACRSSSKSRVVTPIGDGTTRTLTCRSQTSSSTSAWRDPRLRT